MMNYISIFIGLLFSEELMRKIFTGWGINWHWNLSRVLLLQPSSFTIYPSHLILKHYDVRLDSEFDTKYVFRTILYWNMRAGDITAITSKIKSYCYQDLYQKPSEVLLYRDVEEGGLGLHHLKSKAQANLIYTFMQTARNKCFQGSLF